MEYLVELVGKLLSPLAQRIADGVMRYRNRDAVAKQIAADAAKAGAAAKAPQPKLEEIATKDTAP